MICFFLLLIYYSFFFCHTFNLRQIENFSFYDVLHLHLFTFMHLADAFIQTDLQCIQDINFFSSVCVFPGN